MVGGYYCLIYKQIGGPNYAKVYYYRAVPCSISSQEEDEVIQMKFRVSSFARKIGAVGLFGFLPWETVEASSKEDAEKITFLRRKKTHEYLGLVKIEPSPMPRLNLFEPNLVLQPANVCRWHE